MLTSKSHALRRTFEILPLKNDSKSSMLFSVVFLEFYFMSRKQIDEHSLQVLEFAQVRRILASFAASSLGEKAAVELYPSLDYDWIVKRQAETSELKKLLEKDIAIPLAGLRDIGPLIEHCGRGRTVFEPGELLQICDTLGASGRIR